MEGNPSSHADDEKPKALAGDGTNTESMNIVTSVQASDVLLGRGNGVKNWAGNLKYRDLIRSNAHGYVDCQDRGQKDLIAHKVILQIEEPGGRFLKQVSTEVEGSLMGAKWERIPRDAVLAKVRQALRDMAQIVPASPDNGKGTSHRKNTEPGFAHALDRSDGDIYSTGSTIQDSAQLSIGNEQGLQELLRLVHVYRENSAIRYHRLSELVSSLETNMVLASRYQSLQSLPPIQTLDQLSPNLIATKFNLPVGGGIASLGQEAAPGVQRETSKAVGQLKTDEDGPLDNSINEPPSNLAGLLGLVPRNGEAIHTGLTGLNLPPATGNDRLLGDLLAEQQARTRRDGSSGLHLPNSSNIDTLQESARALSDRQLMLQQALAGMSPSNRPLPKDPSGEGGAPPPAPI